MPSYLIETYLARSQAGERARRERRARSAAQELARDRVVVQFERSIYVPEDEICFFLVHAPSGRDAAIVAQRAGLDPVRIVEASPPEGEGEVQARLKTVPEPQEAIPDDSMGGIR